MANDAIGILFEVQGQGDINKGSGKRINGQLRHLVGQINKSSTVRLKFQIDSEHLEKEISKLHKNIQEAVTKTSSGKKGASSGGGDSAVYKAATTAMKEYYDAQARFSRKASRSNNAVHEYKELHEILKAATDQASKYFEISDNGALTVKDNIAGLSDEQRKALETLKEAKNMKYGADIADINSNAEQKWSNLTAKVHDYIDRVQESASRNREAADSLKELREMANSTDYHGYDALKKKLAEVQRYINENSLATDTWGQKMLKTFGSRVRSALAGIIVAKVGQYLREVYVNVVNLDKALVNLQIASGKTRDETKKLIKEYSALAKQLGATTSEVAEAADTWLRQGHSAEDANTLIKNSTMLSKLGQMEAAEASKALTSAMNGYKVEVEDSIKIVDKFTAVDMEAAASAGDIATAMSETAASAEIAGVSMDKLIGYITTVKEVTQDGAESVGTFYRTLFARMNNVAAGKFVDDETGESLNDVETVLKELRISLREANGEFRNSGEVLDEVAERWDSFDNTAQHAIATAFAGTRQQEKFIVLMENYGDALKYAEVSAESAGTAIDKYGAWLEGIEGKLNSLKASFEKLSMSVLNSEFITKSVDVLTWVLDAITWLSGAIGGLNTVLYVTLSILAVMKVDATIALIKNIGASIKVLTGKIMEMVATMIAAKASGLTMGQSISAAFNTVSISASSAQIAVGSVAAALGLLIVAFNAAKQAHDKSVASALSNANAHHLEAEEAKDCKESLDELIRKYEELASKSNWSQDENALQSVKEIQDQIVDLVGDQALAVDLVNGKLDTQLKLLQGISGEYKNIALQEAEAELAEAKVAVQKQTGWTLWSWMSNSDEFELGPEYYYGSRPAGKFGDIKVETKKPGPFSVENYATDMIKVNFDTAEEFAEQYEAVMKYQKSIAGTFDETDKEAVKYFSELTEFLDKYRDVYTQYKTAKDLVDKLTNTTEIEAPKESGFKVSLKSSFDLLEEVQKGYDGISDALANVTSEGYLTADALSTLFKLEKDNALGGLELANILERDANGYKLAGNALEQYVQSIISMYTAKWVGGEYATQADKDNAIANLKNLQAVLATLMQTQDEAVDAGQAYRDELEKQREMYEDQLDKFGELVDLRKELLETYQEELDYQRELERKQRNVASLQSKLALAQLDTSAYGRARARSIADELQQAQEELDDFTLEHAIDVLTSQLDDQYSEYETMIKGKITKIEELLGNIKDNTSAGMDMSWMAGALSQLEDLINRTGGVQFNTKQDAYTKAQDYVTSHGFLESDKNRWGQDKVFLELLRAYIAAGGAIGDLKGKTYHSGGFVGGISNIATNEEFAKLLKGEFVSTPAQMHRFMKDTLPQIANYNVGSGSNEFNAPLIEIRCDNVTNESIPTLKRVVHEAVQEIKKELDSGMGRTGFKRPTPKRLM